MEQWRGLVLGHPLPHRRDVITEGDDSQRKFLDGGGALGMHPIGKRRRDANRRDLDQGPERPGPGRPKVDDGKVQGDDRSRFEGGASDDDAIVLSHQVFHHVPLRRHLRVVLVVETRTRPRAVLFSTDTDMEAQAIDRRDKARFPIECLLRDAKPLTSLSGSQARSQATLHVHFNASLSALTLGKREARQQNGESQAGVSMASVKRRAFNPHLLERIAQPLAHGHRLDKSSPEYQSLCNDGTITDKAA